jgi:hypothetical protein
MTRSTWMLSLIALVVACGSGPNLGSSDIAVVPSPNQICGGSCGNLSGFALGKTGAFVVAVSTSGASSTPPAIAALDFAQGTSTNALWTPTISFNGSNLELAAAGDGNLFWAGSFNGNSQTNGGDGIYIFTGTEAPLTGMNNALAGPLTELAQMGGNSDVDGLVADATDVYVAYGQSTNGVGVGVGGNGGNTPDAQFFPGSSTPFSTRSQGAVVKINRKNPSGAMPSVSGFSFTPGLVLHVLAQNDTDVFWADQSTTTAFRVLAASKADFGSSQPRVIGTVTQGSSNIMIAGVAANKTTVVWVVTPVLDAGVGTKVYASVNGAAATVIADVTQNYSGLAVDDVYAYVTVTQTLTSQQNNGGNNGSSSNGEVLIGTGVARIPLAGGAVQFVSLQSNKWYGPRRVFVDDTYVYAIDPDFVLRFPKTEF